MSELVSLGRPVLAVPVQSYEQSFNAMMVERLGFGRQCKLITADHIQEFMKYVKNGDFCFNSARSLNLPSSIQAALSTIEDLI